MKPMYAVLGFVIFLLVHAQGVFAFETAAPQAILIDHQTGTILLEKDSDIPVPPASLSKLMTSYMVFQEIKNGGLALEDLVPVSEKAWK